MTEKVVSLSGGLVLGMVFALFLGIGVTQNLAPSLHFEMPSILRMTIAQATHSPSRPASNTTPNVNSPTASEEDRGRITRIASLTETTDTVFETTPSTSQTTPKNFYFASTPKIDNSLQIANLSRSDIPVGTESVTYISLGQAARQSNFSAIAGNSSSREGYSSGQSPSFVDDKPQTHGSPAMAQNNPDSEGEGEGPEVAGKTPTPHPESPDSMSNGSSRQPLSPERPDNHRIFPDNGDHSENDPGSPGISQRNRRRPEVD